MTKKKHNGRNLRIWGMNYKHWTIIKMTSTLNKPNSFPNMFNSMKNRKPNRMIPKSAIKTRRKKIKHTNLTLQKSNPNKQSARTFLLKSMKKIKSWNNWMNNLTKIPTNRKICRVAKNRLKAVSKNSLINWMKTGTSARISLKKNRN